MTLRIGNKKVDPDDVRCQLFKDGDKVGIMLFFKDYSEDEEDIYGQIAYLMLDQALGEYDVETKVGFIEFTSNESKYYDGAFPLSALAKYFDELTEK
jgi:hypothetical protein